MTHASNTPVTSFNLRAKLGVRRRSLISLTPLIDVVFILLIFFMLSTSFIDWNTLKLQAPVTASTGGSVEGAILIRILADGTRDLSGSRVSDAELEQRIVTRLAAHPDQNILIQPLAGVSLQRAVDLLDQLTALGGLNISFMRSN